MNQPNSYPSPIPAPRTESDPIDRYSVEELRSSLDLNEKIDLEQAELLSRAGRVSPVIGALAVTYDPVRAGDIQSLQDTGTVLPAPSFKAQLKDASRTSEFYYRSIGSKRPEGPMGEWKGLLVLDHFLKNFSQFDPKDSLAHNLDKDKFEDLYRTAYGLRDSLCFIGERELDVAMEGIGEYWKAYLRDDARNKIFLVTDIADLPQYDKTINKSADYSKSDSYIKHAILDKFTPDELEAYGDRIISHGMRYDADPMFTKIILLDDWSISGSQIQDELKKLQSNPDLRPFIDAQCVEVNLVAASEDRIEQGFTVSPDDSAASTVGIKAFFHARDKGTARYSAHISGLHSSVNHDFAFPLRDMTRVMYGKPYVSGLPELARVFPSYKMSSFRRNELGIIMPGQG